MVKYVLRRLIQAIPTLFGITVLVYLLMSLAPGGPAKALTFSANTTPQQVARVEAALGLNDPLPIQYLRWLLGDDWMRWDTDGDNIADASFILPLDADGDGVNEAPGTRQGIIRGDFGRSFFYRRPVSEMIGERVAATLELGLSALTFALLIGVPIGIFAAVRKGGAFDNVTRVAAVVTNAIPNFWIGLILILIFGSALGWLPMGGRADNPVAQCLVPNAPADLCHYPYIYERLEYLILPTFVLGMGAVAVWSRFMRASMLEVINQDYMRTAKAKGLSNRNVWFGHGARNAMIPLATFLGPAITGLLSGAAITETIFSWPGLGRFGVQAVTSQDYPVVMAVVIVGAVSTILGFILSDILYAIIDPRIRFD
ncbi:MAG: ABC transporter permease [Chloroflexota bacterium]|nr:ABC transporter permease [Chloroflexota bacterium]